MGPVRLLLLHFLLLSFLQVPTFSCSPSDLVALKAFHDGLDSSPLWDFEASSSCCGWVGVRCDGEERVVGLDVSGMGLKGRVGVSIGDLDRLEVFSIRNNSFAGRIPEGLFRLRRLKVLDLSRNELSGTVPVRSELVGIETFNVSFNGLVGNHPVLVGSGNLTRFDAGHNLFDGHLNATLCSASPRLRKVYLSGNRLSGDFPVGFGNCGLLQELGLDSNSIEGGLPDDIFMLSSLEELHVQENLMGGTVAAGIGNLSKLVQLDISSNGFSGRFPDAFGGLTRLKSLCASSNNFSGSLPYSMSNLSSIQVINLRNNSFNGEINLGFANMARLTTLDLGSNHFTGNIPPVLSYCSELKTLNLARNGLEGGIPDGFKNLSSLSFLSLSNNTLSNVFSSLEVLQHCPELTALVLTMNFHGERMPSDGIHGFQNLELLVIANCDLAGTIPPWLAQCSKLKLVDLSWNKLTGNISSWLGELDSLFYIDLSNNSLSGEIPRSMVTMKSLASGYSQPGSPPADFPFFSKRNHRAKGLQYNQLDSFPSSLILSSNRLIGPIWPQFGNLKKLHVLDLSHNNLVGIIPAELSGMSSLEILDLSHNALDGNIPASLTNLTFLSKFSVANNHLVGEVPTGSQFSTFPNSSFEGNTGLCGEHMFPCLKDLLPANSTSLPHNSRQMSKSLIVGMTLGIGFVAILVLALAYLFMSRAHSRRVEDTEKEMLDSEDCLEFSSSGLVLLFQNKDNKELTIEDILKSANNFDQANIIGCGGFGLVYKATLPDGRNVAIKRLSGDFGQIEREFQAEIETLSSAQHENLVLLQGYCKIGGDRILIYSYMENGSLDYWLHEKIDGGSALGWHKRLRIARGAANGLAHLHQACQPHILHRDIKSSNILLDGNFEAHLADFGLARLIRPYDTHVTTDLVGTLGYIPPEYGQASVATFKGDVYSFGVVLLELLTGRRPMDMCKQKECRELKSWVLNMKKEKRESEVFDPFIYDKQHEKQLLHALEVACLCLSSSPKLRPTIQEIVSLLDEIAS